MIGSPCAGRTAPWPLSDVLVQWDEWLPNALTEAGWTIRVAADPGDHPHLIRAQRGDDRDDLIIATTTYQDVALQRAKDQILTVEDVLVHKLIAGRPRDLGDIRSILEAGHEIDWAYVRHWADEFGVADRIDRVRGE